MIYLLTLTCFYFNAASVSATVGDIRFSEITREDGLSDETITAVTEDANGFIWIGTGSGLNRYTGYSIKQYYHSDTDAHSIPSGFIRTIYLSQANDLWIGTLNGLAKYNPLTDNFTVFNSENSVLRDNDIWTISENSAGEILITDRSNIYVLDVTTNDITLLDPRIDFPEDIKVIKDEPTRIWIGSYGYGAYIYDKKKRQLFPLSGDNPWGLLISQQSVFDIKIIDGKYWLATDEGILTFNQLGELTGRIDHEHYPRLPDVSIRNIELVGDKIWFGTVNGLAIYSPKTDQLNILNEETRITTGLNSKLILDITNDMTGATWVATREGLYRYHPDVNSLTLYSHSVSLEGSRGSSRIWGLAEDSEQNIWVATENEGLGRFNPDEGIYKHFLEDFPNSIWDIVIDKNDKIWLATSNGIYKYRYGQGQLQLEDTYLSTNFIDMLFFDGNNVWTWLQGQGLIVIDTDSSKSTNQADTKHSDKLTYHLTNDVINVRAPIYIDNEKRLWLSTKAGIEIYDPATRKIVQTIGAKSGVSSHVVAVYDWGNYYWLTTQSGGVVKVDKLNFEIQAQQTIEISSPIVSSISYNDSIWYASNSELYQIKIPSLTLGIKLTRQQLDFNGYSEDATLLTKNKSLVFGGDKGFHLFNPNFIDLKTVDDIPSKVPELIALQLFGKEVPFTAANSPLDKPLYLVDKLTLQYDESRFSVRFGIVNPVSPQTVKYRYRLTGWDKEWTLAGSERQAYYNNVSFGHYTLEVQAQEDGKQWSPSRTLALTVTPPPWLHTSALLFYGFVIALLTVYILRQYQLKQQNRKIISESEERLKLTLWSSGDELWDWDVFKGQVYRANTWGIIDFPQDNIRTNSAYDANIHPNDIQRVQQALNQHLDGKDDYYEQAYRTRTFNNKWVWVLDRGKVVTRDHNHQATRMTGTLKNIHHLKEAEEQLHLFKRSIENISEGVFITDTRFKFISVNNAYCNYTGETREQALASYLYFHQYPEAFTQEIKKTLKAKGNWCGEVESIRVNGERYEIELNLDAVHDDDGRISHFVGVFSDITSRKNTEKELLKLANSDPLTELPNRSFFQASHQNLVRKGVAHALLCLDMDNFKKINDSLGHQTGDILIKQIAKRIQRITGTSATCYRLGGDEFSVLLEDFSDIHTITHFAQNILDTLSRPFIINKQEFVLSASIGIAFYPDDGLSPQEMLKNADTAMYFAKNNGGNSYQFFSGEMNQNAVRQLQIENLIRHGIKDDLFTVYYQPKVDITTGKLVSMEALVRFVHPQKGIVSPGQFIPLAEQTGQIIEIGEQVLRKACEDTKRWVSEGLFSGRVAVNISAKQFELPDLDDRIDSILRKVGLSPLHLECEITEGTLMVNPDEGLRMMQRLRERGIHLALDDFGTGYSSLAYLKQFPLNTLKIDKAFIDDIANSSVDRHMAAAIINIAHNLGLKVVAEGVEYEEQLAILRKYDCEMLQGFLYSKPLKAERFERLLRENHQLTQIIKHPIA
jgi:diguanylate cyclase (GGDEF)-like protein/PAS domain S-box-containing protein